LQIWQSTEDSKGKAPWKNYWVGNLIHPNPVRYFYWSGMQASEGKEEAWSQINSFCAPGSPWSGKKGTILE